MGGDPDEFIVSMKETQATKGDHKSSLGVTG